MKQGALILEDGSEYKGFVFGAEANTTGEVGKKNTFYDNTYLHLILNLYSLPNWYGRLSRVSYRPIVLS